MTTPISNSLDKYFAEERPAQCDCGRKFTQYKMSERFMRAARHANGHRSAFDKQIPDGWVPLFCPPCERVQLGHEARISEVRQWSNNGEPYAAD